MANGKWSILSRLKGWLIAGLIGIVLGVCGTLFVQAYNPPDPSHTTSPSVVFSRIVSQNEMVSVSQNYNIVDKSTNKGRLFDIIDFAPFDNSYWYRCAGVIKAGVNLKDAQFSYSGHTITVKLEAPYIISNTPDMEKSGVLEENNNIFNPIHIANVDAFKAECIALSEQEAKEGGLLDEAKQVTEQNLKDMFLAALGDEYQVNVEWPSD